MCDFIVANPDRFPSPVLGFMNFSDSWAQSASEGSLPYCQSLGIGYAGTSTFSGDAHQYPALDPKAGRRGREHHLHQLT